MAYFYAVRGVSPYGLDSDDRVLIFSNKKYADRDGRCYIKGHTSRLCKVDDCIRPCMYPKGLDYIKTSMSYNTFKKLSGYPLRIGRPERFYMGQVMM
ncbi:MAG: hypothetical protein ACYTEQ_29880 [Planctomycetota bacterium]|jgi:hypothetical protein